MAGRRPPWQGATVSDGRRDAESELRHQLAEQAKLEVKLLRASSTTTPDAAIGRLIDRAFGDPARLRGAAALLGEKDQEALALLARAQRLAAFPVQDPRPPKPFSPPGATGPG
jgi:hypothetical protein